MHVAIAGLDGRGAMTAEIAILNKTAVALAADSAVTISAGSKEEKIFDSADKLFELCDRNPVGIMIYNGMSFMEAPLPDLIRSFRHNNRVPSKSVSDIAKNFLKFLNSCGLKAPESVKEHGIVAAVGPVFAVIGEEIARSFQRKVIGTAEGSKDDPKQLLNRIIDVVTKNFKRNFSRRKDANFVGDGKFEFSSVEQSLLQKLSENYFPAFSTEQRNIIVEIGKLVLRKHIFLDDYTGVVIAGFGSDDLFPSLISYEIGGMIAGRLKFVETNRVTIDREGPKAQVMPFAQKEMVERFLYGLDEGIESQISQFCQETVLNISEEIIKNVEFEDDGDREVLEDCATDAEIAFLEGLKSRAFDKIRSKSRAEIEDMVEFMPKPELAKMAEALVNLTSLKRRVSRGMETVGGPIDVAVISQSEGFVWIKRKHYFSADLNARYFMRLRRSSEEYAEVADGQAARSRKPRTAKKGKPDERPDPGEVQGIGERGGRDAEGNSRGVPQA